MADEPGHGLLPQLRQLYCDLFAVIERDPEQEVLGVALPVVDGVLSAARQSLAAAGAGAGLASLMVDLISPPAAEAGVPIRAVDAWIVVGQALAALGDAPGAGVTVRPRALTGRHPCDGLAPSSVAAPPAVTGPCWAVVRLAADSATRDEGRS